MEIVKGRPLNVKERLKKEVRVYDLLDELDIEYWRIDHEVAQTMEDCEEVDRILDAVICKNLFLCNRQKTKFYLLMMPGDKAFKTKELSAQIQSARLSFAPEEYMEKFLDITPGSVSVMGLMNDTENQVQLLVDADVLEGEYLGSHPCIALYRIWNRRFDVYAVCISDSHSENKCGNSNSATVSIGNLCFADRLSAKEKITCFAGKYCNRFLSRRYIFSSDAWKFYFIIYI